MRVHRLQTRLFLARGTKSGELFWDRKAVSTYLRSITQTHSDKDSQQFSGGVKFEKKSFFFFVCVTRNVSHVSHRVNSLWDRVQTAETTAEDRNEREHLVAASVCVILLSPETKHINSLLQPLF